MSKESKRTREQALCAPMYAVLYAKLVTIAKGHGYCLAVHGSLARDLDLIAVPWVEDASTPEKLVKAIQEYIGCQSVFPDNPDTPKPHGRKAFSFHLSEYFTGDMYGKGPYIDLGVMPLLPAKASKK